MTKLVYSTGPGGPKPPSDPTEPSSSLSATKQSIHVRIERAGRGGKTVTVAAPFLLVRADAQDLLASLKKACGSGGALRSGTTPQGAPCFLLEIQGDHVARIAALLAERGFKIRGQLTQ